MELTVFCEKPSATLTKGKKYVGHRMRRSWASDNYQCDNSGAFFKCVNDKGRPIIVNFLRFSDYR